MSGHLGGQTRTLPFTGLATVPLAVIGLVLSGVGFLLTFVRPRQPTA